MHTFHRFLAGSSLGLITLTLCGCPPPQRICTSCTYKMATFSNVPSANVESATLEAKVKHIGTCPQGTFPNDCTELLSYEVKCALNSTGVATLPMLVDAAPTNPNRSATLTVRIRGNPTPVVLTGTVATGSGVPTLPVTPCPPPVINPYVTLPNVL